MLAHLKLRLNIEDFNMQISFLQLLRWILLQLLLRDIGISDMSFDLESMLDGGDSSIQPLEAHSLQTKLGVIINFALLTFV